MPLRYHKVKPLREATLETIKLLKETGTPIDEVEMAILEEKPVKNLQRTVASGFKSPGRSGAVAAPVTSRTQDARTRDDILKDRSQARSVGKTPTA
jgi:hypothetical protein